MSTEYQVIARKYRPQSFRSVLGQEAIVTTLKNGIKFNRLAHAYLFCGPRGTGKTTLARIFAKAINCHKLTENLEPCNECSSCKEIASGNSLDVLEIDGASHRGIEDIRKINETVGFKASSGNYKVFIIDEVHMLTKEAFNALLKTLEEPPPKVKFLFATTEPHKVLPTILSRCQRFNLNRIPSAVITAKLNTIAKDMSLSIDQEALHLIATRSEGGLRDAESLLDQVVAFHEGHIDASSVADMLGLMPREVLFSLDKAGKEGNLSLAFDIAHQLFTEGKDLSHFFEALLDHFRTLLLIKISGIGSPLLAISDEDKKHYTNSAALYTREQCIAILDDLIEAQSKIRYAPSIRIALEAILIRIMRTHQRVPVEVLIRRLAELEKFVATTTVVAPAVVETQPQPIAKPAPAALVESATPKAQTVPAAPSAPSKAATTSLTQAIPEELELPLTPPPIAPQANPVQDPKPPLPLPPVPAPSLIPSTAAPKVTIKEQSRYDTLIQFAAVELDGSIQKRFDSPK